jgi:hypothetical protein
MKDNVFSYNVYNMSSYTYEKESNRTERGILTDEFSFCNDEDWIPLLNTTKVGAIGRERCAAYIISHLQTQ